MTSVRKGEQEREGKEMSREGNGCVIGLGG